MGPLCIRSEGSSLAIGNVQLMSLAESLDEEGWQPLMAEGIDDWTVVGDEAWDYDDGSLYAGGRMSHLFSPRGDYKNFEVRAQVKISDGGNSGLYIRATRGTGWPEGYEAQINSSMSDPQKSGSLYTFSPRTVQLVAPDTWFEYQISCQNEGSGTRIKIWMDGFLVNDYLDLERTHTQGHIALQQHHEGSLLEIRDLELRELR